jgi:ABC-type ATPase involved in cell division
LIATHDIELIRRMGKRVLTLERGRMRQDDVRPAAMLVAREAPFLPTA